MVSRGAHESREGKDSRKAAGSDALPAELGYFRLEKYREDLKYPMCSKTALPAWIMQLDWRGKELVTVAAPSYSVETSRILRTRRVSLWMYGQN